MFNIDLKLVHHVYEGILFLPYNYWQLLCPLVLSNVVINIVILYKQNTINKQLLDVWKVTSMIYVVILAISLFGTPVVSVLTHMKTVRKPILEFVLECNCV